MCLSISQSFCSQRGVSYDHYPCCIGPHCTASPPPPHMGPHCTRISSPWLQPCPLLQTWDLFVQGPPGPNPPPQPNMEPHCAGIPVLLTSGDHQWRPIQPPTSSADIWWLLKHIQSTQAGGTHPTWNAFLFLCAMMKKGYDMDKACSLEVTYHLGKNISLWMKGFFVVKLIEALPFYPK